MEENQCNLRWNNHSFTFVNRLDHFRMRELYCDATIACNGMVYPVHKVVLSACSNFFESIFVNTNHQNPVVVLQDVGRVQLENLLTYMYRGEVRIPQPDLPMFIKVAESLQVKGLASPTPDRYPPMQTHGSWNSSLSSPQEGLQSLEASVPHSPHLPYRQETPNRPMYCRDVAPDVKQNEHDLPRLYESEHIKHPQQNDLPLKRRPRVLEHTQNFRQDGTHPKQLDEMEHNQQSWHKESSLRNTPDVDHLPRKLSISSNNIPVEEKSSPVSGLIVSASQGTFQNLVALEEHKIKDEPEDSLDEIDQNSLSIYEETEDPQDEDEFALRISEVQGDHSDPYQSSRTLTDHQLLEVDCCDLGGLEPPRGTPSQNSAASQLRRELLRPLQHKSGLPQIQQPNVQSIPHPVISPREPERPRREPPPLMKIAPPQLPTVMNDCHPPRRSHDALKELQEGSRNSHLLVKAPPTYRSYSAPSQFTLQVHNQQLGPVVVNGGGGGGSTSPETCLDSRMNPAMLPQVVEVPLNLSGQKKLGDEIEKKSKDPFLGKILTNRKKRLRGPKSWEYLVRLLKDPTTNPHLIRWENEPLGVFRLVEPAAIAQRWGRRTGKHSSECLSYENFARGLRYHYATGALMPVSERSFVYKFGPKALRTLEECDVSSFPSI